MKTTVITAIMLFFSMTMFGQRKSFKLPKEWDKGFVISVSHTGSMSGGSSHLRFTHDSCTSVYSSGQASPVKKTFALSEADRSKILNHMKALKVTKIKEGMTFATQDDGWSNLLCFGAHCIEGGSGSKMNDNAKGIFTAACGYLERFAADK